jgi:hypothetical protein
MGRRLLHSKNKVITTLHPQSNDNITPSIKLKAWRKTPPTSVNCMKNEKMEGQKQD